MTPSGNAWRWRQPFSRGEVKLHAASGDLRSVPARCLAEHDLRVIDPHELSAPRQARRHLDRRARTEADLEDAISALDLQQLDRPAVPLAVRRTGCATISHSDRREER